MTSDAVHRAMEVMGVRTAIRYGSEVLSLSLHQRSSREFLSAMVAAPLAEALDGRDRPFGDYRQRGGS
jgi:enoyl-CoA hydratase